MAEDKREDKNSLLAPFHVRDFDNFQARKAEAVNHPSHYGGDTTYETIKVIEAWGLNFNLGNSVKYISRAGKKGDTLEDLKKARFYLEREIQKLEREKK
jgi:hypothetical protein